MDSEASHKTSREGSSTNVDQCCGWAFQWMVQLHENKEYFNYDDILASHHLTL
jgi:hypothetical protein